MPNVYTNTEKNLNDELYSIVDEIKDIIKDIEKNKNNLYNITREHYHELLLDNSDFRYTININHEENQEIIVKDYLLTSKKMLLIRRSINIVGIIIVFIYIALIIISIKTK